MKKTLLTTLFSLFSIFLFGQGDGTIIKRDTVASTILNDTREISVFLPPSYYASDQKYPVLYILDGDYNFRYVSGILELQGAISENIPETILVGISGKGTETYRKNCRPNIKGVKDRGNADQVSDFIEKELIPFVNQKYKTDRYKMLSGHSLGGLFVINTALHKPKLFNSYIAISPALWWENNAINKVADSILSENPNFRSTVYTSLANEKGMGVDKFLAVATKSLLKSKFVVYGIGVFCLILALIWFFRTQKKGSPFILAFAGLSLSAYLFFFYYPSDENFRFRKFPGKNHNSVGEPTYVWALNDIFEAWKTDKLYFDSDSELKEHHKKVVAQYGQAFNLENNVLGYTIYTLKDDPEELKAIQSTLKKKYPNAVAGFNVQWANSLLENGKRDQAKQLINETIKEHPNYYGSYSTLAKIEIKDKNPTLADSLINKALQLSKSQHLRQWQVNELIETKGNIEKWLK